MEVPLNNTRQYVRKVSQHPNKKIPCRLPELKALHSADNMRKQRRQTNAVSPNGRGGISRTFTMSERTSAYEIDSLCLVSDRSISAGNLKVWFGGECTRVVLALGLKNSEISDG